jgi:signal peptidase I
MGNVGQNFTFTAPAPDHETTRSSIISRNLAVLIVFVPSLLVQIAIWMLFLGLGVRWAKVPGVSRGRFITTAILVWLAPIAASLVVGIAAYAILQSDPLPRIMASKEPALSAREIFALGAIPVVNVLVTILVLQKALRASMKQTVMVWLMSLAGSLICWALPLLLVKPFLVEAYKITTMSMAPTLVSPHRVTACPRCGGPAFVNSDDRGERPGRPGLHEEGPSELVICGTCRLASAARDIPPSVHSGDRVLVDKLATPHRWDAVVYFLPEDPSVPYISRLAGLPGESVSIREGAVWIDGKKQAVPPIIAGLEYTSRPGLPMLGAAEKPEHAPEWSLGADEYFVLSDFSARAKDSRVWDRGAPGHSPHAVPRSHLHGVVSYIYWPPNRWRRLH